MLKSWPEGGLEKKHWTFFLTGFMRFRFISTINFVEGNWEWEFCIIHHWDSNWVEIRGKELILMEIVNKGKFSIFIFLSVKFFNSYENKLLSKNIMFVNYGVFCWILVSKKEKTKSKGLIKCRKLDTIPHGFSSRPYGWCHDHEVSFLDLTLENRYLSASISRTPPIEELSLFVFTHQLSMH